MQKQMVFYLLFGLLFTIFNCKNQINNGSKKPSAIVFLSGAGDTSIIERGIDAVPEGDVIRLEWIPSVEEDLNRYRIYRSEENQSGPFFEISSVSVKDSFFLDYSVSVNKRYYYYILVQNDDGMFSDPSDTLDYKLIEKATNLSTTAKADSFSWTDPNDYPSPYYMIRILEVNSQEMIWFSVIEPKFDNIQGTAFNKDGSASLDSLVSGVDYQWRIDIKGPENNCGSESEWVTIKIE
ncbi:hypothetical protein JW824_00965 [bacterium]|nr:hypothetical protein [bacterium]RQV98664.1 MAG: hypothetical protein EH221_01490 [bacterium]